MPEGKAKKVALFGMLIALAFILSYIESIFVLPAQTVGMKLGLANIVILAALYLFGAKQAAVIAVIRVILAGFTFNSISMMIYSFGGVLISFLIMLFLKHTKQFGIVGVSVAGGVGHNIGQILIATLVLGNVLYYLPILFIGGIISGLIIGILGAMVVKKMNHILKFQK